MPSPSPAKRPRHEAIPGSGYTLLAKPFGAVGYWPNWAKLFAGQRLSSPIQSTGSCRDAWGSTTRYKSPISASVGSA